MTQTIYFDANSQAGGHGTKRNPYNSWAQVELHQQWTTLKILSTQPVIEGGLNLYDKQRIKGSKKRPAQFATYADDGIHNGDVFICHGDNRFENIIIVESFRCAFECLYSQNLTLVNVEINNTNTSEALMLYDYEQNSTDPTAIFPWFAISFWGGRNLIDQNMIQPANQESGKLVMHNCRMTNFDQGLGLASGDSLFLTHGNRKHRHTKREYEITDCHFSDMAANAVGQATIVIMSYDGGYINGRISECKFFNIRPADAGNYARAIEYLSVRGKNSNFPQRGKISLGHQLINKCWFREIGGSPIKTGFNAEMIGHSAHFEVRKCKFSNYGVDGVIGQVAGIERGYPAIHDVSGVGSSGRYRVAFHHNEIYDESGLAPAISFQAQGTADLHAHVNHNNIVGATTAITIYSGEINYAYTGLAGHPRAKFDIGHNSITDVDSSLLVFSFGHIFIEGGDEVPVTAPFDYLEIDFHHSCLTSIGERNDNSGDSYYGAAIIVGGQGINAFEEIYGDSIDLGLVDVLVRDNAFTDITGDHYIANNGQTIISRENYYHERLEFSGDGDVKNYEQEAVNKICRENSFSSDSSF